MTDLGVDLEAVAGWLDGNDPIEDPRPVGGGTQNIMVRFRRGGTEYVLRRGPKHLRPNSNAGLLREVRVLRALQDSPVRCPRVLAACEDEAVLDGAVFYLMAPVEGVNATESLPDYAERPESRRAMSLAAVDALATLHAVDHETVGLGDLGKPDGFLERQVPRWRRDLDAYADMDGYPGHELPAVDDVAGWLESRVPQDWTPGILHGDYHLANLMFATDAPDVAAIVDWEMCTIGDPLLDLGWLLATWPSFGGGEHATAAGALGAAGGLADPDELVARYAERSERDLAHVPWYTALASFKLAVILEGTHARACAGKAERAVGDRLHGAAVALMERAADITATPSPK